MTPVFSLPPAPLGGISALCTSVLRLMSFFCLGNKYVLSSTALQTLEVCERKQDKHRPALQGAYSLIDEIGSIQDG